VKRYLLLQLGRIILMAFMLSVLVCGCSSNVEEEDQVRYLIGVSQANLIEPWRIAMNKEIEEEASKYDDMTVIFKDAVQSVSKQKKDVETLLMHGIDLLIISPIDSSALTPTVMEAYSKIPVIILDRAIEGYDYTLYIGPDNSFVGKQAGELILELLGKDGGNVVEIQGTHDSPPVTLRSNGFREILQNHENIKIVGTIIADWQRDKAEEKFKEFLEKNKHISVDAVFAHDDSMAYGAYKAAKSLGLNEIKFVGVGGLEDSNEGIELVQDRILYGTVTCPTGGKAAVQYAVDILNKQKQIPKKIILRSNSITLENISKYIAKANASPKDSRPENKEIILGFAQTGRESEWRMANTESIKTAAMEAGIQLKFIEADNIQEKQIEILRSFIKERVDIIAFSPIVESGWEEVLQEAKDAGIPVIITDRTVNVKDDTLWTAFMGSDFTEEGRRAARWLVEYMNDKGIQREINIVELQGTVGSAPAIERRKGFDEVIINYPNYRIIRSETGDFTFEGGKKVMEKFLKSEGYNIDVLFSHNDDMAVGAIEAIEEFGLKPGKDIVIVSIDASKCAFKAMIEGKLNCTVECNPLLGPQLMQTVKDIMDGKEVPYKVITEEGIFPAEVAKKEFPKRVY